MGSDVGVVDPLTPADANLRDFAFMPIEIGRLFSSGFHAKANDSEWRAGVTLWLKSFHQVPAGSLPDDDAELCRLAELGRDLKTWKKLKPIAMHQWILCSNGRFYHPTVSEKVNEAWDKKEKHRARSKAGNDARWGNRDNSSNEPLGGKASKGRRSDHDGTPFPIQEGHQQGILEGHQQGILEGHQTQGILEGHQKGLQKGLLKDSLNDPKGQGEGEGEIQNLPAQHSTTRAIDKNQSERPAPGAAPGKNELDLVENACRLALSDNAPCDLIIGPMVEIVRKFGQERVSLCLQSESRRHRQIPVKSWKLWARIVSDALNQPTIVAISETKKPKTINVWGGCEWTEENTRLAIERWRKDPKSWFGDIWGPPPDQSRIIRNFAESEGIPLTRFEDQA